MNMGNRYIRDASTKEHGSVYVLDAKEGFKIVHHTIGLQWS